MQRLKFINSRGQEIAFDSFPPFIFWKIQGTELPPVTVISSHSSGQNGYTLHDLLLDEREVRLSCHIHGVEGKQKMFELRRELNHICSPAFGLGSLIYTNDYGSWQTPAFCGSNGYGNKIQNIQTLDVTFECPSAFWLSAEPVQAGLAYVEGGLEFPLKTPGAFGMLGYRVNISNDGDADAPLEFHIDGGALNPVITNVTTGEFIKLSKFLQPHDKLYINTDPENMTVSLVSVDPETNEEVLTNAFGYLTDDSALFKLAPGMNEIIFSSDDENKRVSIRIIFRKRYAGV